MRAWMALLAVIPACGFQSSESKDGGNNGTPDADTRCFGSFVPVCFTTLADVPKMPAMLPSDLTIEIDTESSMLCDQHNDQMGNYCVVAGAGFMLPATKSIRGIGSKPLVLLSTTTMTLEAASTVDVSSNRTVGPQARGAGGDSSTCASGALPELAGGGYGGSFGGKGGDGERLAGAAATSGVAAAALTSPPTMLLRGGCPGGVGNASGGGTGGSGGGAVAIIAGTSITLDGTLNASGAGGRGGGTSTCGGGGGGSGGMIVLDAPSITGGGSLFANGGGGGQGGEPGGGHQGADGGESPDPPTPALAGYNSIRDGGSGGAGSAGTSRLAGGDAGGGGKSAVNNGGGGGGGGGAGFIRAHGITTNISPPSFIP